MAMKENIMPQNKSTFIHLHDEEQGQRKQIMFYGLKQLNIMTEEPTGTSKGLKLLFKSPSTLAADGVCSGGEL